MPCSLLRSVEDAIHPAGSPLVLLHGCVHAQKVPVAWICTAGSPCPMAMLGGEVQRCHNPWYERETSGMSES